jgi:O-antigen ligase
MNRLSPHRQDRLMLGTPDMHVAGGSATSLTPVDRPGRLPVAVGIALAALLLWLPLPFGSVQGWAQTVLQVAAFTLAATALLRAHGPLPRPVPTVAALLAAVALVGAIQLVPLPEGAVATISPGAAELEAGARSILAASGLAARTAHRLTLAVPPTRDAALTWAAVAACLLAAGVLAGDRRIRRLLAATLAGSALIQLLIGVPAWAAASTTIWGVEVPTPAFRLRGTFVNADHLALYLELALAVLFAASWWALRRARLDHIRDLRLLLVALPVVLWPILLAGIAFTGSRAGLVAALAMTLMQGLLLALRRRRRWPVVAAVAAVAAGIAVIAALGFEAGFWRWMGTSGFELTWNDRLAVYSAAATLWPRFPILGCGLGAFADAFPLVSPPFAVVFDHAHNDYLELLVTAGMVGVILVATAITVAAVTLLRRLRVVARSEDAAAILAALGAMTAVAIHSAFDFGLQMPANAATLAILAGVALSIPKPRITGENGRPMHVS